MKDDWSDLAKSWDEIAKDEVRTVKQIAIEVFTQEITVPFWKGGNSPIKTGNWMANNIATSGSPTNRTTKAEDETGAQTLAKILKVADKAATYSPFYIQNNTEYNNEIEYVGWANTSPYRPYRTAGSVLDNVVEGL